MRYFMAGGAVRDMLLGRRPTEFDIVFDGSPEDLARERGSLHRVGRDIPTYIVRGHDHVPLAGTIPADLLARDFTINALLLEENGIIHSLPTSFADLRDGIIRLAAADSLARDPLRVLRAARFCAVLPGFTLAPETADAARATARTPAFCAIAAERVGKECMKAAAAPLPGTFLLTLAQVGALAPWFAPLDGAAAIPAGPARYHGTNSVLEHTAAVMDAVAARPLGPTFTQKDRTLAVWMALCHDLGKITTPGDELPHHIGHEARGEEPALSLARRLRLPRLWEKAGALAALLHMKAGAYSRLRPGTKVDLLHTLTANRLAAPLFALAAADSHDDSVPEQMEEDMRRILAVRLPEAWRNKGTASAERLRTLRIEALLRGRQTGGRNQTVAPCAL